MGEHFRVERNIRDGIFSLETGRLATLADGSVYVSYKDTGVLITCVLDDKILTDIDFVPLTVEYREKNYAAGKIPGGFFKREGKPTEKEVLTARLIDRSLRPLLPSHLRQELQVIAWVISSDQDSNPDFISLTGASAALYLSQVPFFTPVAGLRVGLIENNFVINPGIKELEKSEMDIIVAGTKDAIVMVEGGGKELSEAIIIEAFKFSQPYIKILTDMQEELRNKTGKPKIDIPQSTIVFDFINILREGFYDRLKQALRIKEKVDRRAKLKEIKDEVCKYVGIVNEDDERILHLDFAFKEVEKEIMRKWIKNGEPRIDGRKSNDIREIECEITVLPRTHGSAIFKRGETQALVVSTLGTPEDEQIIDGLEGESTKKFMLHYNFPPFSVGEVKPIKGPSRREIGHGALAERALLPVLPSGDEFSYTIRIVSDILESNGSSSMATVCGASLSLMDAGVPIKDAVAGVAMGLIKEEGENIILTDILGDEDHLGDMDFKVAGTKNGITSIQMDIKISGINFDIMLDALIKAREARLHILNIMSKTISEPKKTLSPYAPRIFTINIRQDRIKDLIGPGGKNIKSIIEQTGVKIDVDDSGHVKIYAISEEDAKKTLELIRLYTKEAEVGKVYNGKVKKIVDFGAFVEIFSGTEGLVHISQLDLKRVKKVDDILKVGDEVLVKVIGIDNDGKIQLSRKAVLLEENNKYEKRGKL